MCNISSPFVNTGYKAAFFAVILLLMSFQNSYGERLDLTEQVEYLGSPFYGRYPGKSGSYARNIWDMISYEGKLYLGAGNSSNIGPSPNAGPVPVISFDPETTLFSTVFIVDEEQVDRFFQFNGVLYIPGHDARENWSAGNFYTFSPPKLAWEKHRTIPGAIHVYALVYYKDCLYAGLGTKNKKSIVFSCDSGVTWRQYRTGISRVYDFLVVKEKLLALGPIYPKVFVERLEWNKAFTNKTAFELKGDGELLLREDLCLPGVIFPDTELKDTEVYKIVNSTQYNNKSIYIGAKTHNDHHSLPFGAYLASSLEEGQVTIDKVVLPEGFIPWDILVKKDSIFILTSKKDRSATEVSLWQSNNGLDWNELFYLELPTFARSFEILDGYLYLGMGNEISGHKDWKKENLFQESGEIIRVPLSKILLNLLSEKSH